LARDIETLSRTSEKINNESPFLQTSAFICCSAPIATLLATLWIPESPIWLLQAGRYDDADKAIARMNRRESDFLQEVSQTQYTGPGVNTLNQI